MRVAGPQSVAPSALTGEPRVAHRPRRVPHVSGAYTADIASLGILLLLVAAVSWVRLWRDPSFANWDVSTFFLPFFSYMGEHLRHLDVPGWTPNIFSGTPFAAESESGWGYLPAMLPFTFLSPLLAYKVFVISEFLLATVSCYVLARLTGLRSLGSFAAASYFTFGPTIGVVQCCTIFSELTVWIPPTLVGVELTSRARFWSTRLLWIAFTGVGISQILSGWLGQGSYYGLLTVGSYFVVRTVLVPPSNVRPFFARVVGLGLTGSLSFAIGLGLGAAALLPRLDNVGRTFVGSDAYRQVNCDSRCGDPWYFTFHKVMSFLSYWSPFYVGGAALACLTIGLLELPRHRELRFFAGLGVVVVILSMEPTRLHELFFALPEFEGLHLHDPQRVLTLLPLSVAMLVGAGVEGFARIVRVSSKWMLGYPLVAHVIWWIVVLSVPVAMFSVVSFTHRAYVLSCAVIFAGILLARTWTRQRLPWLVPVERMLPVVLVLLILWDPTGRAVLDDLSAPVGNAAAREAIVFSAAATDPGGAGEFLQARQAAGEYFRYFGYVAPPTTNWQAHEHVPPILPFLHNNRALRLGLQDIQGYNPAQLDRYRRYFQALNSRRIGYHEASVYYSGLTSPLIDLLNVRYIIVPNNAVTDHARYDLFLLSLKYDEVFKDDKVRVLANPNALPRAWMVHDVSRASSSHALRLLAEGKVDPRERALVEVQRPKVRQLPTGTQDQVTITGYDDDSITLTANAKADGLLVLSEVYNPGWHVTVDGKLAELYQTDYLLRGVVVPKGSHEIVFTYKPKSLTYGLYITFATSAIAVVILLGAALWWLSTHRRTRRGFRPVG